jgi:hypothetical protein
MFKAISYNTVTTYRCPCNGMYKGPIAEETILRTHFGLRANSYNCCLKICTNNLINYFILDDLYVDIHTDVPFEDSGISTCINIYIATSS